MKEGFRRQELDGCEMTLGFRQVRAARERNTLRHVLYVLSLTMKGVDGMGDADAFYGSPHGAFIGQVPWVTSKERDLLGLLHGIRSVEISRYPESLSVPGS